MSELEELRTRYDNLQVEWDFQQENISKMEDELQALRRQLQYQSTFCASLGAVMGSLVWKASRESRFVDLVVMSEHMDELLNIVNGTLLSFMETFSVEMPADCYDESQFILSMVGTMANVAACPPGRQFLVDNANARELIQQFIRVLSAVPVPSGNSLKRLLLMVLYNMSINQKGVRFLQEQEELAPVLGCSLRCDSVPEPRLMTVRLLQSLTNDIPNLLLLDDMQEHVYESVEDLAKGGGADPETTRIANLVYDNLERAKMKFGLSPAGRCVGGVPFDQCSYVKAQGTINTCNK